MYWNSIIWFLTWPVLIIIAYQLVKYTMKKYKDEFEHIEE